MWALRPGRARGRSAGSDLEALYRAHFGLVWSLVGRYGVRPSHREDVVQEVWLTVHRRLPSFDPAQSAAHWIAGVTRFIAWRHIRTMIRADRKLDALRDASRNDDPVVDRETILHVGAALASLEPMFRDAVMSVEVEGWSGPEAAARLGVPLNTLYSRLRLGRRRLRDTLVELERTDQSREPVPREAAARTWAAIAPIVAPLGKASVLGSFGAWLLVPAAAIVGLGVVAVAPTAPEQPTIATTAVELQSVPATKREPAAIAHAPETAPSEPVAIEPVEPVIVRASAVTPVKPASVRDIDDAGDEATILSAALDAIRRRDGFAALEILQEHETRFADGELAIDRRSARVRALCLVGKSAQARGEAATLLREHPDAPAAIAVRNVCAP